MANVTGRIALTANINQAITSIPTTNAGQPPSVQASTSPAFANATSGVAADQVDTFYCKKGLSVPHATPVVLDLTALADIFGNAITFARVKSIVIVMYAATDGTTLSLGYSTTTANAWVSLVTNPGQIVIEAAPTASNQAFFALAAPNATGYPVSSTNKLLELTSSSDTGGVMTVDIFIEGCSA